MQPCVRCESLEFMKIPQQKKLFWRYLQQGTQSLQFKFKARNIYLDKSATDIVFLWSNRDTYFVNEKKGGKKDTEMPKWM